MKKLLFIGAGPHAKVVLEAARSRKDIRIAGLVDADPRLKGKKLAGCPILGNDSILPTLTPRQATHFVITVGSNRADGNRLRQTLFQKAVAAGLKPLSIIHSSAIVAPSARVGLGTVILSGAIITSDASIGNNVIINTGSIIDHDAQISDHAHLSPGVKLGGSVSIGKGAFVGLGTCVKHRCRIGGWATVGAGSVVLRDVPAETVVAGVPAKPLKLLQKVVLS